MTSSGDRSIRSIAIVGGGTAGWSAAALLGKVLAGSGCRVTLIESSEIPTVGVGEATIPPIFEFLRNIGADELDFIRRTQATFKLAIRFEDWLHRGHRYWHPFGNFGITINQRPFFHYWWKNEAAGYGESLADFSPAIALAENHKFALPPPDGSFPGGALAYALHFDAGLVASYLRELAERLGVERLDRKVASATLDDRGHVGELLFEDGSRFAADFYIDCSGFRGLLIGETLKTGYVDWRRWLPCDRAVAAPSPHLDDRPPYTVATAREAGWQWRIPLQHRVGNGYVYSSEFIGDEAAAERLVGSLQGGAEAEPRFLRFTAGHRRSFWVGNCLAIGLSAGFLEPLESTSIHLIITGLNRLLDYFPDRSFDPILAANYNREAVAELEHIRDFLILHYYPNRREGEPFWDHVRNVDLPDSLREKMTLFESSGRVVQRNRQLFADISWFFVAYGMGIRPKTFDPLVDIGAFGDVRNVIDQMRATMGQYAAAARSHDWILERMLSSGGPKPTFNRGAASIYV